MLPEYEKPASRIFERLDAGEQRAQRDGQHQAPFQALAVVCEQRMVRPGHRGARGQQQQRVEQRQVEGIEQFDAGRRPDAAGGGDAGDLLDVVEAEEAVEIGPEPGDEEHHFGGDEQHHAVAVMHLHHRGVVARCWLP